jgi:hypothetical protein
MNDVYAAAAEMQEFLQRQGWRFCFIGGIAVIRWGQPRATLDVDITLLTGFGGEEAFVEPLLAHFQARVPDAAAFAIKSRVVLMTASNGTPVDVALGGLPFEENAMERATPFQFGPALTLVTCSAEDLVVAKAFAGRKLDWADVENVAIRQVGKLDWTYIETQLLALCAMQEDMEALRQLRRIREGVE